MRNKTWIRRIEGMVLFTGIIVMAGCSKDSDGNPAKEIDKMMVMVDDTLYASDGSISDIDARCGVMDGEISSSVKETKAPTKNNQSNFGKGYGYQYVDEKSIDVYMNEEWIRFEKTTVVSNQKMEGDFIEDASPETSAMSFLESDGSTVECSLLYNSSKEREILDYLNGLDAYHVTSININELEGPMYGITIGRKDGFEFAATWWDGYWFMGDDTIYQMDVDFSKIKEDYDWEDKDTYPLLALPNLYQIATVDGSWNTELLSLSNELPSDGLSLEIENLEENIITVSITNPTDEEVYYGEYWSVQAYLDGSWYDIPTKENWGFNDIAYILQTGEKSEKTYNLKLYGDLPAGTYRLVVEGATAEFLIESSDCSDNNETKIG